MIEIENGTACRVHVLLSRFCPILVLSLTLFGIDLEFS